MNMQQQDGTTQVVDEADPTPGAIRENNMRPTVIITGPPWPRSGTARVMQNQIEYYRARGYVTVFICVPIHCSYTESHSDWDNIKIGIQELGADQIFFATIDSRRFATGKYLAWVQHAFHGTALDWIVFTARSAQLPDEALRLIRQHHVVLMHVNHVFTLGFAQHLLRSTVRANRYVPMILDTHDIQSNALEDRGEINPWTHRRDRLDHLLSSEMAYLNKANVLVHVSVDDFNFFRSRLPHKRHVLALPTINETSTFGLDVARQSSMEPIDLLFVGHGTTPNAAAIEWFFEQVWPLIEHCGYRIKIVGGIEAWVRKELPVLYQTFSSYFVGPMAELDPAYRAARCVFAPMVSGTGISIKTIEALALGKPFVGTSKAYRGMPMDLIEQAGLRAHDTPREFADAISYALSSEHLAAAASRAAYARIFSNQASFSARDEALEIATAKQDTH
jgi:glycosyltransferase involved in cell wall biosynthesis